MSRCHHLQKPSQPSGRARPAPVCSPSALGTCQAVPAWNIAARPPQLSGPQQSCVGTRGMDRQMPLLLRCCHLLSGPVQGPLPSCPFFLSPEFGVSIGGHNHLPPYTVIRSPPCSSPRQLYCVLRRGPAQRSQVFCGICAVLKAILYMQEVVGE